MIVQGIFLIPDIAYVSRYVVYTRFVNKLTTIQSIIYFVSTIIYLFLCIFAFGFGKASLLRRTRYAMYILCLFRKSRNSAWYKDGCYFMENRSVFLWPVLCSRVEPCLIFRGSGRSAIKTLDLWSEGHAFKSQHHLEQLVQMR